MRSRWPAASARRRRHPADTWEARPGSPRSTKRWWSSIASSSCSLPRRAAWCRAGIRSIATATPSRRCADRSRCCRVRSACGRRCRPSRAWRSAAAASARCACRRSTAGCSRPRTRRSPIACRSTTASSRQALLALTTRQGRGGFERIAYGDLGVEQLGGVYEHLLDFDPAGLPGPSGPLVRSERRKSTGAFYTPRPLTEYLVRRALAPLVHEASPEAILALRILDPAMGSGAFLVAACRYLASAYEAALVREGAVSADDITERERAEFRRAIAQRCLYGVDINPMAVQLGRLSLWLATLSADRPLTFLDHRLRTGNSLVGASPSDIARQAPGGDRRARPGVLPLFGRRLLRRHAARRDRRQVAHRHRTWRHARAGARQGTRPDRAAPRRRAGRALEGRVRRVVWRVVRGTRPAPGAGTVRRNRGPDPGPRPPARSRGGAARRRREDDRGARALLSLDVRVSRGLPRPRRRSAPGARVRRDRRQPALGDVARRSRRRRHEGDRADGGGEVDRLRSRFRDLHRAGRRPRQPVSTVPGTHPRPAAPRRPARYAPAVWSRDRPGSRTRSAASSSIGTRSTA